VTRSSAHRRRSRLAAAAEAEAQQTADLLARFRDGDEDAFRALVGAYEERLVQFFYRLCWDLDRAEDFAQELFMRLVRGAPGYQPRGCLSTFIFRIATNLWIDHYRSTRPQPRLFSLDQPMRDDVAAAGANSCDAAPGPIESAIDGEERAQLRAALEALHEPHRLVFELAVYQQLPYATISEILSIPVGTVKSRMHTTVQALRARLGQPDGAAGEAARPRAAGGA
jgi:RNA polymerase sigma-70 factor (ECF subfamily)